MRSEFGKLNYSADQQRLPNQNWELTPMATPEMQKFGTDVIGDMVAWSAHYCLFLRDEKGSSRGGHQRGYRQAALGGAIYVFAYGMRSLRIWTQCVHTSLPCKGSRELHRHGDRRALGVATERWTVTPVSVPVN